jgi:hypothetical protein
LWRHITTEHYRALSLHIKVTTGTTIPNTTEEVTTDFWVFPDGPFICITKYYVDRWMAAEGVPKLALEAILKAAKEHETAHWLFTLVRHIRMPLESLTDP